MTGLESVASAPNYTWVHAFVMYLIIRYLDFSIIIERETEISCMDDNL